MKDESSAADDNELLDGTSAALPRRGPHLDGTSAALPRRGPHLDDRGYQGPERRRHRVFVTRNTEYHFRDGFCVAVRDRRTGEFLHGHLALCRRVHGGIRFFPNGAIAPNPGDPRPGDSLYFASDGRDLVTSPVERIERPSKELAGAYAARRKA